MHAGRLADAGNGSLATGIVALCEAAVTPSLSTLLNDPGPAGRVGLLALATRVGQDAAGLPTTELRSAEIEVERIAACWRDCGVPVTTMLGASASRTALLEPAATARLADTPMEASLLLADGELDGLDLAALRMRASLVVLAACHAARRAVAARGLASLPGDSVYGLQAAFREAGAGAVIGALWSAHDDATPPIMGYLHKALAAGRAPAAALREAIDTYRTQANRIRRDPSFWACFTLVAFDGRILDADGHRRLPSGTAPHEETV